MASQLAVVSSTSRLFMACSVSLSIHMTSSDSLAAFTLFSSTAIMICCSYLLKWWCSSVVSGRYLWRILGSLGRSSSWHHDRCVRNLCRVVGGHGRSSTCHLYRWGRTDARLGKQAHLKESRNRFKPVGTWHVRNWFKPTGTCRPRKASHPNRPVRIKQDADSSTLFHNVQHCLYWAMLHR